MMLKWKEALDSALAEYCESVPICLQDSTKHILLSKGRRVRGLLTMAWCELSGGRAEDALPYAVAIELVHTVSLLQDDLPCMDNAEMRRGKQCAHLKYGEANILLTGDVMLCQAMAMVSPRGANLLRDSALKLCEGQALDLSGSDDWERIHAGKTASLMAAACALGVIATGGSEDQLQCASRWGYDLGMGYQLMDDFRDKDGAYVFVGADKTRALADEYLARCTVDGDDETTVMLRKWLKQLIGSM